MTDVVAVLSIAIEADPRKVEAALSRVEARLQRAGAEGQRAGRGIGDGVTTAAPKIQKTERDILNLARVTAQLQRESGDLVSAQRTLEGALARVDQSTVAAINTKRQLLKVENELAAAAQQNAGGIGGFVKSLGGLGAALSTVGIGFAADQAIQFGVNAARSANELEQTTAVMRQLAGSQERYDQIVQLATGNQRLFGGSLNSNLVPMNSLLQLANRTGAELNNLNSTTQLLLASSPNKSFGDASFGLSEFLGGTGAEAAISLADQFNLPKAALTELAQAGTTAEQRLAGLNALLAEQGVTAATLEARLTTTAATYDQLGASLGNLQTAFGSVLSQGLEPFAQKATLAAQGLTQIVAASQGQQTQIGSLQQQLAATATSYEEYRARAEAANAASTAQANAMLGNIPILGGIAAAASNAALGTQILSEAEYEAANAAQTSAGAAQNVASSDIARATAAAAAAGAARESAAAATEDALAQLEQSAAAERAAQQHDDLERAILAAASASGDATVAASRIAEAFGLELPRVLALINAHRELNAARAGGSANVSAAVADFRAGERNPSSDPSRAAFLEKMAANRLKYEQEQARIAARSAGRGAGRSGGGAGGSTAERAAKAAEREAQQEAEARERIAEQFFERRLDAEESFQERLTAITQEFAKKRNDADAAFGDAQVSNRSGFYQSLASVDKGQRTAMIQEYEAAQVKAAEIAASQGGDAGQEYLSQITEVIRARADRQAAIAKALESGDQAEAQFLRDIDQMARSDEQRKLDKVASGGNGLAAEEAQARSDAEQQRQDALTEAAATAGKALGEIERKKKGDTDETNLALQTQLQLYDQLAQRGSLAAGAPAPQSPPAPAGPSPASAPPAGALPGSPNGGPTTVTDPSLEAAVRRMAADLERAIRAAGDRPNYSAGV